MISVDIDLCLLKNKFETFEKFKEYKAEVEKQIGESIKTLRSDQGGEYLSYKFKNYLQECGIVSQLTPPGTPLMNGYLKGGIVPYWTWCDRL